jgi:hypothetical protein
VLKGAVAAVLGCLAVLGPGASVARADACGVPDARPLWVDYAGHDAPIPARPGVVLAVSSGTETPAAMRAAGASTIFFDLNFNKRVGTPTAPADPATIADKAKRLYDFAVSVTGCTTPIVAENELFGAQTPTPWSTTNAQYRANVLALLQGLAALGARPALTIANPPYTGDEAADWWREVAKVALLVRQVYFTSPNARGLYALGPVRASRSMRGGLRSLVRHLTEIDIPPSRIALELQFQSAPGLGARAGLQPRFKWLEIVKLEALAAKQVARETQIDSVWSWGWATFSTAGIDPDKAAAACVWLWARDPQLCDGAKAGGSNFNASLTEGQLVLPSGARCVLEGGTIDRKQTGRLAAVTGDASLAASALLERAVLRAEIPLDPRGVLSAERAIVASAFGGSRARYVSALARAHVTVIDARALIADHLARTDIEARFRPQRPPGRQVDDFLATYADVPARLVETKTPAPWLGDEVRGWAVATLAPPRIFTLRVRRPVSIDTVDGRISVRALGPAVPLGFLPRAQAVVAARAALVRLEKQDVYRSWLKARELAQLANAICARDDLPSTGPVDLSPFVPFLSGAS